MSRAADGTVRLLKHQDAGGNGNPNFDCTIQLGECSRPERTPAAFPDGYRAARQIENEEGEYPLKEYEVTMQISPPTEDLTDESVSSYSVDFAANTFFPYLKLTQLESVWGWHNWNPCVELAYPAVQKPAV